MSVPPPLPSPQRQPSGWAIVQGIIGFVFFWIWAVVLWLLAFAGSARMELMPTLLVFAIGLALVGVVHALGLRIISRGFCYGVLSFLLIGLLQYLIGLLGIL